MNFIEEAYSLNPIFMYYIWILILVFGLVIGSFLNVVGLRFLSNESIVLPPSKCPKCGTVLKWYDNIPVLAYVLLMGKCRYCKTRISPQYPIVEATTALMFLFTFLKFGFTFATPMLWVLICGCIVMCITDFKEQIIFDAISIPLIPIGLVYSFFNLAGETSNSVALFNWGFSLQETFINGIIGIIVAFAFFEIISLISKFIIKNRAFGEGDTIIAMIFGAWFGWKILIITIVLGFLLQAIFTLPLLLIKLAKNKDKVAILSFSLLICSAILPILLNKIPWFYTSIGSLLEIVLVLSIAIISALTFLKRTRELDAYTMLPFGPALITGGFLALFFSSYFMKFLII